MTDHHDPVDAVILAYLDYVEGVADRPSLDGLDADDRRRALARLDGLAAARGLGSDLARPSIEALLTGTPLAALIPAVGARGEADPTTVREVLAGIDARARVEIEVDTGQVVFGYLDLRARFLLTDGPTPAVTGAVRSTVESLFGADPDTSWIGIVAAGSPDLVTQMLTADAVGSAISTPRGDPHLRWEPPLPLALAARRMVERGAPEWPAFDFDGARGEPLDVAGVAADLARRIIARESERAYRGEKRTAYRGLVGQEHAIADLVTRIADPTARVDLTAEIDRIARAAA